MDPIIFRNFVRASLEVADALERDCSLNELDQLRFENYLAVMQMAYIQWKRRQVASNPSAVEARSIGDESASQVCRSGYEFKQ